MMFEARMCKMDFSFGKMEQKREEKVPKVLMRVSVLRIADVIVATLSKEADILDILVMTKRF
jgi:hypothetical protein